ncbi:MAG: hypothetical protein IJL17_03470 [Kiritimatiellae bacterium]|nr:hypothetical protein [Kiritimatiellia bacterium]
MRKALVRVVVLVALAAVVVGGVWAWTRRPWRVAAAVNGVALTARELDLRAEALGGDRRETVRTWIAKQVLLDEAVQRNVSVAEADEREAKSILTAWLASRGVTPEQFFTEGPLPEEARRRDLQEGLLIHTFVKDGLLTKTFPEFYRPLRERAEVRCPEFPELEGLDTGTALYAWLWGWRPARVSVAAAGQVVTSAELDLRVLNTLDDLRRRGLAPPKEREASILPALRRHEAQTWIVKAVMRAEAARRGFLVTSDDEKEQMERKARALKPHRLTVGQFFKEGVLPEALKWDDFRSEIRVGKFTAREVREKISVTTQEIEARMAELRKRAAEEAARGAKPTVRSDRKTAIDQLHNERYVKGFRDLFRSLFDSARVWSPEFPEMERVDGVSLPIFKERSR